MTPETYPHRPGYKRTGTSKDAADMVAGRADIQKRMILDVLKRHPLGLLPDEIAARIGEDKISIRARCTEMKGPKENTIHETGMRRLNPGSNRRANVVALGPKPRQTKMDF